MSHQEKSKDEQLLALFLQLDNGRSSTFYSFDLLIMHVPHGHKMTSLH